MARKNIADRLRRDIGKIVSIELNEKTKAYLNIGKDRYGRYMFVNDTEDSLFDKEPCYTGVAVFPLKMEYIGKPGKYGILMGGNINSISVTRTDAIDKLWKGRKCL